MSPLRTLIAFALLSLVLAAPAAAHPRLVAASPAPNSTVGAAVRIELRFSERLVAQFSGVTIYPIGRISTPPLAVAPSRDGMGLVGTFRAPLQPGSYRISWRAVSVDTHRLQGQYIFRVR